MTEDERKAQYVILRLQGCDIARVYRATRFELHPGHLMLEPFEPLCGGNGRMSNGRGRGTPGGWIKSCDDCRTIYQMLYNNS